MMYLFSHYLHEILVCYNEYFQSIVQSLAFMLAFFFFMLIEDGAYRLLCIFLLVIHIV